MPDRPRLRLAVTEDRRGGPIGSGPDVIDGSNDPDVINAGSGADKVNGLGDDDRMGHA